MFMVWMRRYHPTRYLYLVARACGRSRQDIEVEGTGPVSMNTSYYLEFLVSRLGSRGDSILEKSLHHFFSVEMVSLLRVFSILHISLFLPLRWLARNCGDLEEFQFGVANMHWAIDLMDEAFTKIMVGGDLLLNRIQGTVAYMRPLK